MSTFLVDFFRLRSKPEALSCLRYNADTRFTSPACSDAACRGISNEPAKPLISLIRPISLISPQQRHQKKELHHTL